MRHTVFFHHPTQASTNPFYVDPFLTFPFSQLEHTDYLLEHPQNTLNFRHPLGVVGVDREPERRAVSAVRNNPPGAGPLPPSSKYGKLSIQAGGVDNGGDPPGGGNG